MENIHKVGAIGVPGYGWQCKILAEDGSGEVAQGEVGELCVKGPGRNDLLLQRSPEATAQVLTPDGWLKTGDMAMQDADGFTIWWTGRKT